MNSRAHIQRARSLRRAATPPEVRLWGFLRTLRATHHLRRQAPFRGYVLDFVSYRRRLVIEVDGDQHGHAGPAAHDATRDAVLRREGFRVLRVTAVDVMANLEGVATAILMALEDAATPCDRAHRVAPRTVGAARLGHEGEDALDFPVQTCS